MTSLSLHKYLVVIPWLLLVMCINLSTMPAFRYGGDSAAIEMASVQLIKSGNISVPEEIASTFGDRGQFYFENIKKGRWFSKYGLGNTVILSIPRGIERLFIGQLTYRSKYRLISLNIFNCVLSLILFLYLFKYSGLYSKKTHVRIVFCLSVFYCTYLWNYLRAQSSEIYQTLFFVGFCYHAVLYFRSAWACGHDSLDDKSKFNLLVTLAFLGWLCMVKIVFILMIPGLILALLRHMVTRNLKMWDIKKLFAMPGVFWTLNVSLSFVFGLVTIIALVNYYKFGSIFETGYGQWEGEHSFLITNIPTNCVEAIFHPQKSILIHFPVIILSFFGVKQFIKTNRQEALFIASIVLPVYILYFSFGNWTGEWGYGPRYCLFALPVLASSAVLAIEQSLSRKDGLILFFIAVLFSMTLVYSAFLQWNVNSLKFNISYEIRYVIFGGSNDPIIMEYYKRRNLGLINYDLIRFRDSGKRLPFLEHLYDSQNNELIKEIEDKISKILTPNNVWIKREKNHFGRVKT